MQDEARDEPRGPVDILATAHENPLGRPAAAAGPQRKDHDSARPPVKLGQERVQTVGAMDEGDAAPGAHHGEAETHPCPEIGTALDAGPGPARIGRWRGAAGLQMGRVGHDVGERAGAEPRRRPGNVADHHLDPPAKPVERDVLGRQADHVAPDLDPRHMTARHAPGQA